MTVTADDYDRTKEFRTEDGRRFIVLAEEYVRNPTNIVDDTDLLDIQERNWILWGDEENRNPLIRAMCGYLKAHGEVLTNDALPALFRGTHCELFKCDGWVDYNFLFDGQMMCVVRKELGTAEEWARYYKLYQEDTAWRVIDLDKRSETRSIYEETPDGALSSYLESGALASLDRKVKEILRKETI